MITPGYGEGPEALSAPAYSAISSIAVAFPIGEQENPVLLLTKRQRRIAELVMRGMSNREIGKELFISQETVKRHLYNTYLKLGVKNRVQLLRKLSGFL